MKETVLKSALLAVAGVCLMAGSASAMPWDTLGSAYVVSGNMDYWTATDLTTAVNGNSLFNIELEQASYESGFGLYTKNDDGTLKAKFEIFEKTAEPDDPKKNVTFKVESGQWFMTTEWTDDGNNNDNWQNFESQFGFYYDVYTEGASDSTLDYTFFTDNSLNTQDSGEEHIMTAYNANDKWLYVYLDDQIAVNGSGRDYDYIDMTVFVNDVQPVPEPSTMLLFGAGLAGLAGVARRKKMNR